MHRAYQVAAVRAMRIWRTVVPARQRAGAIGRTRFGGGPGGRKIDGTNFSGYGLTVLNPNHRMPKKTSSLFPVALLAAVFAGSAAFAQNNPPAPAAAAPAPKALAVGSLTELPAANHLVYLAQLPSAADLTEGAAARGITITRIDQTKESIVVVYQYSDGRLDTFAYTLLSAANSSDRPRVADGQPTTMPQSSVVYTQSPPPNTTTIVYTSEPETVYYRPRYVRYYEPAYDFWGPLALGVGIGWISGGHHHHGDYGHGHGGRHR